MEDVRFFYLVFWLILVEFYLVGKAALLLRGHRLECAPAETASGNLLTRFLIADLAMILVFGTAYYLLPSTNRDKLTTVSATLSLLTGEAQRYDAQVEAQNAILTDPATKGQDVEVVAVTDHPKLLYAAGLELQEDPTNWINQAVADFYEKASVTLVREGE